MRILHIIFSSRIAGAERYCIDLANRQAELGHEVAVVGLQSSPIADHLRDSITYYGFGLRLFHRFWLRRLVAKMTVDICHAHLSPACKALSSLGKHPAKVATLHVGYKPHQHARLEGVICVNRSQVERLTEYPGQVIHVPNWLAQIPKVVGGWGIRTELGLGDDRFVVGAVGRLHASKGMDVLIAAFRATAPASAVLVILGDGSQRAVLERQCSGDRRIHLLGFRDNVYSMLCGVDLFVSPSREESFGLAILEAMSVGLPIVATATDGPREFLCRQPAELILPDSVAALTEAIDRAYAKFCTTGLPKVTYDLSPFDPAQRVDEITTFYRQVIAGSRVPMPDRSVSLAS